MESPNANEARFQHKVSTLKSLLTEASDFKTIYDWFFDNLGADDEFLQLGRPEKKGLLEAVLAGVVKTLVRSDVLVIEVTTIYIEPLRFSHGPCIVNGRMGGFLYFDDIDRGLLALTADPATDLIAYARFSSFRIEPAGGSPILVAGPGTVN